MTFEGSKKGTRKFVEETGRDDYWRAVQDEMAPYMMDIAERVKPKYCVTRRCPVCDMDGHRFLFYKDGLGIHQCTHCEMIYIRHPLKDEILQKIYGSSKSMELWIETLLKQEDLDINKFTDFLDELESWVETVDGTGLLIDDGCSIGTFIMLARSRGWDTIGLEISEKAREVAKEKYDLELIPKTLEELDFPRGCEDAITLWEVLEHVSDPRAKLKECFQVLKPRGILALLVPNVASLASTVLHEKCAMYGKNHLNYFSPETLSRILDAEGFRVMKISTIITEANTIWNHMNFLNPYEGDLQAPDWLNSIFDSRGMDDLLLGYKLLVFARKP